jgi:hypothetical protein
MINEFTAFYRPGILDVANLDEATRIIQPGDGASTPHPWVTETPYFTDLMTRTVAPATHGSRPGERSGGGKVS